ncbi:MAG: metal-dependent transcriptional regulator [Bacteroidota bacterium]
MSTQAVEDYLKAVYELAGADDRVGTSALADKLGVTPASATGMVKKLAGLGFVTHEKYQGVALTPAGRDIALEILRHHRLVELYLVKKMGVPWDQVHDEAEKWEHVLSEDLEDRMDAMLGHPSFDPHGAPIPQRDGTMASRVRIPLVKIEAGTRVIVSEVSDHDSELLRYVGELGLFPGTAFDVITLAPYNGPLTVEVDGAQHVIGREAAHYIFVRPAESE